MVRVILFVWMLFFPILVEAAYTVYLKNGSTITGVRSYERQDKEVVIEFGGGSVGIPAQDVLKIEASETPVRDFRKEESGDAAGLPEPAPAIMGAPDDQEARAGALKAEQDSIDEELKAVLEEEERIRKEIAEKQGRRTRYNIYQLRQLEKELEPLEQDLYSIRQRKNDLLQRKTQTEEETRSPE